MLRSNDYFTHRTHFTPTLMLHIFFGDGHRISVAVREGEIKDCIE